MANDFLHQSLTKRLIGVYYEVYNELGFGFLESVYQRALAVAFEKCGLRFAKQAPLAVWFRGKNVGRFWADFLVEDSVIIEIKAVRVLEPAHEARLINYLRATDIEVGLLFNFGERASFKRLVFSNGRKPGRG